MRKVRVLRWGIILNYPAGPNIAAEILMRGRQAGGSESGKEMGRMKQRSVIQWLTGAMSPGAWEASRSQKRSGTDSPPKALQKEPSLPTP